MLGNNISADLEPLQFTCQPNKSDKEAATLHKHLHCKKAHVRMLFIDYSSDFSTIVPISVKSERPGPLQRYLVVDVWLSNRQTSDTHTPSCLY